MRLKGSNNGDCSDNCDDQLHRQRTTTLELWSSTTVIVIDKGGDRPPSASRRGAGERSTPHVALSAELAAAPAWDSSSNDRSEIGVAGVAEQERTADFKFETAGA